MSREKIESFIFEDFIPERRSKGILRVVDGFALSKEWFSCPPESNLLFNTISGANQISPTLRSGVYKKSVVVNGRQGLRKAKGRRDGIGLKIPKDPL
jgi:hypothetical protein